MISHLHLARGFAVGPANIAAANIGEIGINLSTVYTNRGFSGPVNSPFGSSSLCLDELSH